MTILYMDGCDTYTSTSDATMRLPGSIAVGMGISTTGGRFGGGCISCGNLSSSQPSYMGPVTFTHTGASAILAGGCYFPQTNGSGPALCLFNSLAGTPATELWLDYSGGFFRLYRGYQTTLLATTAGTYAAAVWHHIEMKATIADSGGTCEVRINGQTAINFSGDTRASTTGTAGIDRVYYCTPSSSAAGGAWDDMYVLDTSGSVANNFLGDVRINTLAPTSDASVQFTKSTGASNFSCVDEGRMNSDTDYVESSTVGHIDRYGFADLAAAVTTVYGVQPIVWCRKTDASLRTVRTKLVSGATTSDGASYAPQTSYTPTVTPYTTDPNTSAQWTVANANAATSGFEIVT